MFLFKNVVPLRWCYEKYTWTCTLLHWYSTMQCCGSALVSMRIRIHYFWTMRIRIQGFDDQKLENQLKNLINIFCISKMAINLSQGLHKGRPSYRRSLHLSKRTSSTWNFFTFLSHSADQNTDPDPSHWYNVQCMYTSRLVIGRKFLSFVRRKCWLVDYRRQHRHRQSFSNIQIDSSCRRISLLYHWWNHLQTI